MLPFTGNYFYVNPLIGADGNAGTPDQPLSTLSGALARCTAGNNDVVFIVGNGGTSATCRLSSTLTWSKNATHLIGITAPAMIAQRARIAPTAGVTAFADFVNVTASGCAFMNFSTFDGFTTGTTAQRCWIDEGSRNYYGNVQFGGMGDAASAADAGSRSLVIGLAGSGENLFEHCVIGLDTVSRGAANASIEFKGGTPRNIFRKCVLPFYASASSPLGIIASGAASMDRFQLFEDCTFLNAASSGATTMSGLSTLAASAGGGIVFKNPTLVGITEFGTDATSRAQCWVDGGAPTAGTTGIAVNPT
jgi:hypothetical protein